MKPWVAGLAALVLALGLGLGSPALVARAHAPAAAPAQHLLPEAPKKTPKAKPTKTASPTPTPVATARPRTAADEEGERWVQIAMIAGGGMLGAVALFFGIGALLRRKPRRRN